MRRDEFLADFKAHGRIVIVGASLAGLSAAETLRAEGFVGPLTIIGDEPDLPYDPPPALQKRPDRLVACRPHGPPAVG